MSPKLKCHQTKMSPKMKSKTIFFLFFLGSSQPRSNQGQLKKKEEVGTDCLGLVPTLAIPHFLLQKLHNQWLRLKIAFNLKLTTGGKFQVLALVIWVCEYFKDGGGI